MTTTDRLKWLEQNGVVPDDADQTDWDLAKQTTWWGKPLDPKAFWNGKVVWLSTQAVSAAGRYGRGYPPIPYADNTLPHYNDDKKASLESVGVEAGSGVQASYSSEEAAFWAKFVKTHPLPPEEIASQQILTALQTVHGVPGSQDNAGVSGILRNQPVALGYPPEAFSENALFWVYVLDQRAKYEKYEGMSDPASQGQIDILLGRLKVAPAYVTQPLTADQIAAANSWKIAYLNRLEQQNIDPSYINAYLQAWKLPASAISGNTSK